MKWKETTEKNGRIENDMFVTDSRGKYIFVQVSGGEIVERRELTYSEKVNIIHTHRLDGAYSGIFKNCVTYRTKSGNELINRLLSNVTGM